MPIERKVCDFYKETKKFHQPQKCVKSGSTGVTDLLSPHPNMVLAVRTFLFQSNPNRAVAVFDDELEAKIKFMKMVRSRLGEETEIHKQFLDLLILYRNGGDKDGSVSRGICDLFKGHADLHDAFTSIVGHSSEHGDDNEDGLSDLETQGMAFCDNLKRKLAENCDDDKAYLGFLKMLNDQSTGFIELQMFVSDLVGNCPVIMKELDNFLQACEDPTL